MNKSIEIILNFRKLLLLRIEPLTEEQLNLIPSGFSNNIIWNLGHMNAVLQALCYRNSKLPLTVENNSFLPFLPGTKPEESLNSNSIKLIKQQFIDSVNQLDKDLQTGVFKEYERSERIEKVYNIKVETVSDALKYVTHHDGIHFHAIMALRKVIENNP